MQYKVCEKDIILMMMINNINNIGNNGDKISSFIIIIYLNWEEGLEKDPAI